MEDEFLTINVEYRFSSFLGTPDEESCIKDYNGKIYCGPYSDNTENEYIGEVNCKVIYRYIRLGRPSLHCWSPILFGLFFTILSINL